MFLAKLSIDRPILVSMAVLVFVVFGALAYFELPLNLMPDMELPFVSVVTVYPGAGPREVETQITNKVEEAAATVAQIDYIQSFSVENASIVMIAFDQKKDINLANAEVKDKVDGILSSLPDGVDRPSVQKFDFSAFPFMDLVLSGNMDGRDLYELADGQIKERLSQIHGVAQVSISGGAKREIDIELPNRVVFQNTVSPMMLNQLIAAQNLDLPAGSFDAGSQQYSVRLKGEFQSVEEIENMEIPTYAGPKRLGSLAKVIDGHEKISQRSIYFNAATGHESDNIVRISITKSSDGNVVSIAEDVHKLLPDLRDDLPPEAGLNVIRDDSAFTKATVSDTMTTIWLGILLTGLILLLFLHDLRSTFIVALSMPISMISTFIFLNSLGFTLNMLTLTGFSTSVGILVTNSVVVIENIFRHKGLGLGKKEAAFKGTSEITIAVLASALTNIVVFLPLAQMKSLIGSVLREFALTVTFATIFSLIASFTIVPMLSSIILPEKIKLGKFGQVFDKWFEGFGRAYQRLMKFLLRNKRTSVGVMVFSVLLFVGSLFLIPKLGFELMPTMDQGTVNITIELPEGSNLEETARVVKAVNDRVTKYPEVAHVVSSIGSSGMMSRATNIGGSDIELIPKKERKRSTLDLVNVVTHDLADIPNALIKVSGTQSMAMGSSGVSFYLQGQDQEVLEELKKDVIEKIRDIPGLLNLDSSSRPGVTELTLYPKRDKLAQIGATVYELAIGLRSSIEGMVATYLREGGNQYDIRVTLPEEDYNHPDKILNMNVLVNGQNYLLSELVDTDFAPGIHRLIHIDRFKSIEITGNAAKGYTTGNINAEITRRLGEIRFPSGYEIRMGQMSRMLDETIFDMIRTFVIAVLLTYMLLAAILESLTQPLIIMSTVPLGLIGVVLALFISGTAINIISMLAIIMLVGIVVNNAILILDHVNMKRKEGMNSRDALLEAGMLKLKPIIMSTLSIVIGMLPMALGIGPSGREMRMSMGIVSIGGIVVSTLLALIVIPAFYYLTTHNDKKNKEITQ